jgi:hypothetical protein
MIIRAAVVITGRCFGTVRSDIIDVGFIVKVYIITENNKHSNSIPYNATTIKTTTNATITMAI